MQESKDYKRIVIERTSGYEYHFRIPYDYLENNGIELKDVSTVLNEIEDEYLILDANYQGVWIPKEIVKPEKVIIDDGLNS